MIGWKWAAEAYDERDCDEWTGDGEGDGRIGYAWSAPSKFSCRRCGRYPLTWGNKCGGWRPYENGKPHVCPKPPASAEFIPIQVPEIQRGN